jgi:hypothetical protein
MAVKPSGSRRRGQDWYLFLSAHRTDPAVIRREMEASGYVLSDRHDVLEYQSFQEFKKSAAKEDTSK